MKPVEKSDEQTYVEVGLEETLTNMFLKGIKGSKKRDQILITDLDKLSSEEDTEIINVINKLLNEGKIEKIDNSTCILSESYYERLLNS